MPIYNISNQNSTQYDTPPKPLFQDKISINNKYGYDFDIALPTVDNFKLKQRYSPLSFSDDRVCNKSKLVSSDNSQQSFDNIVISESKFGNLLPHQNEIHLANPWKRIDN